MKINGSEWSNDFYPSYTPKELLEMGIFGGKYFNNIKDEFPEEWFEYAKMVKEGEKPDYSLNYFKVGASLSLQSWKDKGWIYAEDPNGWMQWYFNYFLGRRSKEMDAVQIKRWKSLVSRHMGLVYSRGKYTPKQGQALLQWAYNIDLKNSDEARALFNKKFKKFSKGEKRL